MQVSVREGSAGDKGGKGVSASRGRERQGKAREGNSVSGIYT